MSITMPKQLYQCRCPSCQEDLTDNVEVTNLTDGKPVPTPGDLTLCIHCGEVLMFKVGVFKLTEDDTARIKRVPNTWELIQSLSTKLKAILAERKTH